ncbi:GGDEF domain-containing protein [Azospirillaceae bacterium]
MTIEPLNRYKISLTDVLAPIGITGQQLLALLSPFSHPPEVQEQRARLVVSRVRLLSGFFAVLVTLWIPFDYFFFQWPQWIQLTLLRLATTFFFIVLAWPRSFNQIRIAAFFMTVAMLGAPLLFSIASSPLLASLTRYSNPDFHQFIGNIFQHLYGLLPFIIVAGLSVFPLAAMEVLGLAFPIFITTAIQRYQGGQTPWDVYISELWLMLLIIGVSVVSGMSQLHYLIALVKQSTHDSLTGAYNRRAGAEVLEQAFLRAQRTQTPLSVAFLDLDRFKSINDTYGHEAGDEALRTMVQCLTHSLTFHDQLIRWGGEEFLLLFSRSDKEQAYARVLALRTAGFGRRPDGEPLTASIGISERIADQASDWHALVELADHRMYVAKTSGRDRIVIETSGLLEQQQLFLP